MTETRWYRVTMICTSPEDPGQSFTITSSVKTTSAAAALAEGIPKLNRNTVITTHPAWPATEITCAVIPEP